MKTFKEFQTESYSRLDEGWGWGGKIASELWKRAPGGLIGHQIHNTVGSDVGNALPGKDGKKVKNTKTNIKGDVASTAIGAFGDQIVKKGWKYGVKPTYSLAKWGVTKGIPGAISTGGKVISALAAMNKMH